MSYILCLGFNSKIYRTAPKVRIFLNNFFLDEYDINNNSLECSHPFISEYSDDLYQFKQDAGGRLTPNTVFSSLHKVKNFFNNQLCLKFFDLSEKYINSAIAHNLKIEIFNNDNNYTNGFLTKSTYVTLSIAYLIPKKILVNYKVFLDEYFTSLKNQRIQHSNLKQIKNYYNSYNFKFDILNFASKNKREKLIWIDQENNKNKYGVYEWIGITGSTELLFDNKIFIFDKLNIAKEEINGTLLYSLGNKYTQYESQ